LFCHKYAVLAKVPVRRNGATIPRNALASRLKVVIFL
jgi:hypothetical protein